MKKTLLNRLAPASQAQSELVIESIQVENILTSVPDTPSVAPQQNVSSKNWPTVFEFQKEKITPELVSYLANCENKAEKEHVRELIRALHTKMSDLTE